MATKSSLTFLNVLHCLILHGILFEILQSKKGHMNKINHFDFYALYMIQVKKKVDFTLNTVFEMKEIEDGALGYGYMLTKKFNYFDIPTTPSEIIGIFGPNNTTIKATLYLVKDVKQAIGP